MTIDGPLTAKEQWLLVRDVCVAAKAHPIWTPNHHILQLGWAEDGQRGGFWWAIIGIPS